MTLQLLDGRVDGFGPGDFGLPVPPGTVDADYLLLLGLIGEMEKSRRRAQNADKLVRVEVFDDVGHVIELLGFFVGSRAEGVEPYDGVGDVGSELVGRYIVKDSGQDVDVPAKLRRKPGAFGIKSK